MESFTLQVRAGNRGVRADGTEFPLEASFSRVVVAGRKLYTVIVRDVTERQRAEERIREQATLLDQARDAIIVRDLEDHILYWNRGAERLYGWTAAEALGKNAAALLYRGPSLELEAAHRAVLEQGEWVGNLRQLNRAGKELIVESHRTLLRDAQGEPRAKLMINTDVTEKKKLQAELLQVQKMEGIGLLAGGVAHDFNNLLTIITGYSELLLTGAVSADTMQKLLREIKLAGDRATGLTRQLLAFSRKQILQPVVLDLNALVTEIGKMLRRLIGEDIDLTCSLDPTLGSVKADPGQVEQVLLNLAVNARDAMPEGGQLTLETRNVELDETYANRRLGVRPGRYVLLAVADTGCGMDEATRARIFEPFFTTKEVGKGTGLGLSVVHGIVQQSGGHIQVSSEVGHGSVFKIYLPRIEQARTSGPSSLGLVRVPKGTETVLLAEDDEGTRATICLALRTYGYTVLEATSGEEALRICHAHSGRIHLLMTDVVMPRMSGRQLAERIAVLRPDTQVLYISGYTDDAIVRHGILQAGWPFLQKPLTPTALARKVREVLDQPAALPAALAPT